MDCWEGLEHLDDNSIDCCISSPPYWSLRDYGIESTIWDADPNCEHDFKINVTKIKSWEDNSWKWISDGEIIGKNNNFARWDHETKKIEKEIKEGFCSKCGAWKGALGLEPNFELFIKHLCDIYDDVKRVLKKSGTCWVNLGDTYSGSGGAGGDYNKGGLREGQPRYKQIKPQKIPSKCLLMLPQRFAIEMVNRGWILRNVIIWHKPNCMPSSAKDRFTVDFEYVYLFVKSNKTQYWINEKIGKSVSKQPLGTKGTENVDWEWRECGKCLGTGVEYKKCKFCVEIGWYYDEFLRPRKCPECRGLGRIKMDSECKSCKGKGIKKYNFWKGKQYFFEQQREGLSLSKANVERRKYKVGKKLDKRKIDNTNDGNVKPNTPFQHYHIQDLPQENDFPLLKYTENDLIDIEKNKNLNIIYSRNSKKGDVQETNNPRLRWGHTRTELKEIERQKNYIGNIPLGKNKRTVWTIPTKANPEIHFATFPPLLVEPMIKSGCPEFICKECGKPREKIIETININYNSNLKYDSKYEKNEYGQTLQGFQRNDSIVKQREYSRVKAKKLFPNNIKKQKEYIKQVHDSNTGKPKKVIGLTNCNHSQQWKSGIVLDPFAGIGTTLLTAWKLGRNYIGFEISKEYCKIANKKLDITNYIRLDNFIKKKMKICN